MRSITHEVASFNPLAKQAKACSLGIPAFDLSPSKQEAGMRRRFWTPVLLLMCSATSGCVKRLPVESPIDLDWTSPQVVRFSARPPVIHRGESVVLAWNVRNVSRVLLEEALEPDSAGPNGLLHSIGDFPANGTVSVSPATSATYVLSCGPRSEAGLECASASVSVVVKAVVK
jgi:hypothetical protein